METLHRLAGVQDASDFSSAEPAHLVSSNDPYASEAATTYDQDGETGSRSNRASRASLPLNRQPSRKSLRDGRSITSDVPPTPRLHKMNSNHGNHPPIPRTSVETADTAAGEEVFAWGPTHPCFPHPNPHCLPTSPDFTQTRVIRVRRDWVVAGDLYPQYANLYPEILDPMVSDAEFRFLISNINAILKRAFSPFTLRAWIDAVLGVVTGFLWEDLGLTGAKQGTGEVEKFIDRWNDERKREGKNVQVVQLKTTCFMNLDFIIPDPEIDVEIEGRVVEGTRIGSTE